MSRTEQVVDAMVRLGRLSLRFARVDRITYHEDGVMPESDTDHTVMLGLLACSLADEHFPQLRLGLVAQYALAHDLPEAYAGDTPTLRMPTASSKEEKARRERDAFIRVAMEFDDSFPWLASIIAQYEKLADPEARFVKTLDKLLPKITHLLNDAITIRAQQMTVQELIDRYEHQVEEMSPYASDFPELMEIREVLIERVLDRLRNRND